MAAVGCPPRESQPPVWFLTSTEDCYDARIARVLEDGKGAVRLLTLPPGVHANAETVVYNIVASLTKVPALEWERVLSNFNVTDLGDSSIESSSGIEEQNYVPCVLWSCGRSSLSNMFSGSPPDRPELPHAPPFPAYEALPAPINAGMYVSGAERHTAGTLPETVSVRGAVAPSTPSVVSSHRTPNDGQPSISPTAAPIGAPPLACIQPPLGMTAEPPHCGPDHAPAPPTDSDDLPHVSSLPPLPPPRASGGQCLMSSFGCRVKSDGAEPEQLVPTYNASAAPLIPDSAVPDVDNAGSTAPPLMSDSRVTLRTDRPLAEALSHHSALSSFQPLLPSIGHVAAQTSLSPCSRLASTNVELLSPSSRPSRVPLTAVEGLRISPPLLPPVVATSCLYPSPLVCPVADASCPPVDNLRAPSTAPPTGVNTIPVDYRKAFSSVVDLLNYSLELNPDVAQWLKCPTAVPARAALIYLESPDFICIVTSIARTRPEFPLVTVYCCDVNMDSRLSCYFSELLGDLQVLFFPNDCTTPPGSWPWVCAYC